jgi:ABC-type multidrug transport system permease subunit
MNPQQDWIHLHTGFITRGIISVHVPQIFLIFRGYVVSVLVATGMGLIIASWVRAESTATHADIALTPLTAFMGGMFLPYDMCLYSNGLQDSLPSPQPMLSWVIFWKENILRIIIH